MAQPQLPDPDARRASASRLRPVSMPAVPAHRRWASRFWGPKARVDLARRLPAPLIVAAVPLFWVADATYRASLTTIGRDQGIFQYVAWAVGRGDVDYRDVRDVNGPLVHMIHMAILALGGWDEHRFHVLELAATAATFALAAWFLPGIVRRARPMVLERAAWAIAGGVVLMGQYGLYLYWNQAQRESFCDWFLLPSLGLMLAPPARTQRGAKARVVAVAALSAITWFGKPSFALFTMAQLASLLVDPEVGIRRRARLAWFAVGGALGALGPLLYLLVYGDAIAWARITFVDVPTVYRFIWAKSTPEILGEEGPLGVASAGLAASALVLALVARRELPRRYLALGLAPLAALGSALAQKKGFGYHFHPLTATTHLAMLAVVVFLTERFRGRRPAETLGRWIGLASAAALALFVASNMKASPHERNVWILAGGEDAYHRSLPEYFDTFKSYDFFPREMREAAAYLAEKTAPDARVQMYGMDPYLLFLARRRSATPYVYAYDLNDDAALDGGFHNRPDDAQAAAIRAARDAHEHDLLARLEAKPPEAFVFVDRAPLVSYPDAWEDFRHCCAATSRWLAAHYHPARSFGEVHVWLRDDMPVPDVEKGME